MTIISKGKQYLVGLTSIRFFLALLVVLLHCNHNLQAFNIYWFAELPILNKGSFAVDCFFILSGFLLTYLAINEYKNFGTINIRKFFIRRILRIFPLYYLAVVLGYISMSIIYPYLTGETYFSFDPKTGILYHLFFLPNWIAAKYTQNVGSLNSLWSIGVEEQFYLFFPFLMLFSLKIKRPFVVFLVLYIVYLCFYTLYSQIKIFEGNSALIRFIELLKFHLMFIGGVFAVLFENYKEFISKYAKNLIFKLLVMAGFVLLFFSNHLETKIVLSSITFCLFLIFLNTSPGTFFITENKYLLHLGKISYGIYIYHGLVTYPVRYIMMSSEKVLHLISHFPHFYYFIVILSTFLVAHISYEYFEKRFMKLKMKFSSLSNF